MKLLIQPEPMRDALIELWMDAYLRFSKITAKQLGTQSKYHRTTFEVKKDPRIRLAEILMENPEMAELYRTLFAFFSAEGAKRVVTIIDTYQAQGIASIREAMQDITSLGLGEKEAAQLLNRYVDEALKGSLWQAERIVRTEAAAAANQSSLEEAQRTGAMVVKEWGALPQPKVTRPSHLEADGQTRELNQPFNVGGVLLMAPSDPKVNAPQETVNCRCCILYIRKTQPYDSPN
jgi:uncharacterized protein with gpF-like domain